MIAAISKPATCERSTFYLLGKPGARLLGHTTASDRPREIIQELNLNSSRSARVEKPFFHASLRPAPGETLSEEDWHVIGRRFLVHMGYADCPGFVVLHTDAPQHHIHVFASRVRWTDGKAVPDAWDYYRAMDFARQIEHEYGLRVVQHPSDRITGAGAPDEDSVRRIILAAIDRAGEGEPTMSAFVGRLREQGIEVRVNLASTGRVSGISFESQGYAFKGSSLGRSYSWAGLQSKFDIRYDPSRDLEALRPGGSLSLQRTEPARPPVRSAQAQEQAPARPPRTSPPHLSEIERAAAAHLDALGSQRFTIFLARRQGPLVRTWTKEQVLKSLSWLKYQNDLGARVLVQPQSASTIHLDDMDRDRIERARTAGCQPAAVVETAPGRFEAWFQHPETLYRHEVRDLGEILAFKVGGRANHGGFGHLAGFDAGQSPVRLDAAPGGAYEQARTLLKTLREWHQTGQVLAASEPGLRRDLPDFETEALRGRVTIEPRGLSLQEARDAYEQSRSAAGRSLLRAFDDPAAEQEALDSVRTAHLARLRFELMSGVAVPRGAAETAPIEAAARLSSALRQAQDHAAVPSSGRHEALRRAEETSARLAAEHLRQRLDDATKAAGTVRLQRLPNVDRLAARYERAARALDKAQDRPARLTAEIALENERYDLNRAFHLMMLERRRLSQRLDRLEGLSGHHPRPDRVDRRHGRTLARAEKVERRLDQLEPLVARADREALSRDVERLSRLVSAGRRDLAGRLDSDVQQLVRIDPRASIGPQQLRDIGAAVSREDASRSSAAEAAFRAARRDLSRELRQARADLGPRQPAPFGLAEALDVHTCTETARAWLRSPPRGEGAARESLRALLREVQMGDRTPETVEALRRTLRHHAAPAALAPLPEAIRAQTPLIQAVLQARRDAAEMIRAARAVSRSELPTPEQMDRLARAVVRFQASAAEAHRARLDLEGLATPTMFEHRRGSALPAAAAWAQHAIPRLSAPVALESLRRGSARLPTTSGGAAAVLVGYLAGRLMIRARAAAVEMARGRRAEQDYER